MMIGKDSFLEMKFFGIDGDSACFELSNCTYHEFFFLFSTMNIKSCASETVHWLLTFSDRDNFERTVPEANIRVQHQFERQEKLK